MGQGWVRLGSGSGGCGASGAAGGLQAPIRVGCGQNVQPGAAARGAIGQDGREPAVGCEGAGIPRNNL
ncbi:MAG: hypothetical protein CMC08_04040 [Flavobacteriaceae bacterium]|nr:hypothetical protein [Flavobacteriaceae bacterium]